MQTATAMLPTQNKYRVRKALSCHVESGIRHREGQADHRQHDKQFEIPEMKPFTHLSYIRGEMCLIQVRLLRNGIWRPNARSEAKVLWPKSERVRLLPHRGRVPPFQRLSSPFRGVAGFSVYPVVCPLASRLQRKKLRTEV